MVLYMVFSGRLLKPGGSAPEGVLQPFATWQFWAVVAGFVAVRWFVYWWDWVRGAEAAFMPPAGVVAAPLRRLFVLQFGVLVGGLIVYWPLDSSSAALIVAASSWSRRRRWRWPCSSACARRASAPLAEAGIERWRPGRGEASSRRRRAGRPRAGRDGGRRRERRR